MNTLLEKAKNEVAVKYGYESFEEMNNDENNCILSDPKETSIFIDEVAIKYKELCESK